jgi:hypothetical protein
VAGARAELAKNAPPIDYAASFDSLDIMEKVMRHFYLRALLSTSLVSMQTSHSSIRCTARRHGRLDQRIVTRYAIC